MSEGPDDKKEKKGAKLIRFPGGKDSGMDYVLGQVSDVPTADIVDPAAIERDVREREAFVQNQDLVLKTEPGTPTHETIDVILRECAEELAHLKWERKKAAKEGKNTAPFTVSRINSLRSLGELLLKKKTSSLSETLDLKSPRIKALFNIWMELFHDSMIKAGVEDRDVTLVFETMKADLPSWERKMEAI